MKFNTIFLRELMTAIDKYFREKNPVFTKKVAINLGEPGS